MIKGKHIILGITGGIAAYKSVMLLRLLVKAGAEVQVVMTQNAKEFVSPVTFSSLSGNPVISDFFTSNTGEWHSHVDLGLWADLMVIAPATASTIGKMANGIADNMLITTYLSAKEDVMIAPAMDLDMWKHPSTQRNILTLEKDKVRIIYPSAGSLASGLEGKGRMAEPQEIFNAIDKYFSSGQNLKGIKALVTAGPTYENIDPVRFIGNYSSGKMGFALSKALADEGAEVYLITGPVALPTPENNNIKRINVVSAVEMFKESEKYFPESEISIFAAAVADYAPEKISEKKIKREKEEEINIILKRNPDIAASLSQSKTKKQTTIGFALETDNELENAKIKLNKKCLDIVVLNSMNDPEAGFMKDTNRVTIITKEGGLKNFGTKSKEEVAKDIVNEIIKYRSTITKI